MRRVLIVLVVLAMALGLAIPAAADSHLGDPAKVAICHFSGHDAGIEFGPGFTGDYVINFGADGPSPYYCEEYLADYMGGDYSGEMIIVSVKALKGHDVEGLDRIADYPDGWKG